MEGLYPLCTENAMATETIFQQQDSRSIYFLDTRIPTSPPFYSHLPLDSFVLQLPLPSVALDTYYFIFLLASIIFFFFFSIFPFLSLFFASRFFSLLLLANFCALFLPSCRCCRRHRSHRLHEELYAVFSSSFCTSCEPWMYVKKRNHTERAHQYTTAKRETTHTLSLSLTHSHPA